MLKVEEKLQHSFYSGNNYKDVTVKVGCKVSRQMTNSQPTENEIYSNFEKSNLKSEEWSRAQKNFLEAIFRSSNESVQEVLSNYTDVLEEVQE